MFLHLEAAFGFEWYSR